MKQAACCFFVIIIVFTTIFTAVLPVTVFAAADEKGKSAPKVRAQLKFSPPQKKTLVSMFSGVIDDPVLAAAVPELKEVVENSLVRLFIKTSFEAILNDFSTASFFYGTGGENKGGAGLGDDRSAAAVFTFYRPDTAGRIYSARKDLLEVLHYEKGSTQEITVVEDDRRSGYDFVYAKVGGKAVSPALMRVGKHIAALYCALPSAEKFGELAEKVAVFIMERFCGEKDPESVCGEIPPGFVKDCGLLISADLAAPAVEDTTAAALLDRAIVGVKLADDMSSLIIDSFISFKDGVNETGGAEKSGLGTAAGAAAESVYAKTARALKLLFRPITGAPTAADYIQPGVMAFVEFNLNFNDDFLALTDVFVFRGILLTAIGVDYKEDFLSWFNGNIFFALGGPDFKLDDILAPKDKTAVAAPLAYVGLGSKNADLASKFGGKLAALIADYFPQAKVKEIKIDGAAAYCVTINGAPYFKDFEAVFGPAGDYYLIAASKEAFEKQAAAAKSKANALSAEPGFKNAAGRGEGRFFNFYVNYRPVRAALEKLVGSKPEIELLASLPLEYYISGASMTASGGIESRAVFSLDKQTAALAVSKFSAASLARYFDMFGRLLK